MNKITIGSQHEPSGLPEAAVKIEIKLQFSDDCPPALVESIGRSIAELALAWQSEDMLQKLADQCNEIRARHQRQADHAARMLIGDEEPDAQP